LPSHALDFSDQTNQPPPFVIALEANIVASLNVYVERPVPIAPGTNRRDLLGSRHGHPIQVGLAIPDYVEITQHIYNLAPFFKQLIL
jgi:hypothetical protein